MGLPYAGMNFVAGWLGVAAAGLILWRSPFPLGVRFLLPLAYFLCYQYAVIGRSYALLPPLVFACAALFPRARKCEPVLVHCRCCACMACGQRTRDDPRCFDRSRRPRSIP